MIFKRSQLLASFFIGVLCSGQPDLEEVRHFRTRHGDTLLHAAVKSRRVRALGAFLELGCPPEAVDRESRTALRLATEMGEVEHMEMLAKYGSDLRERYGQFNETLLHGAAKNGRDLAVFWLLERGAWTEARDAGGWTPLHSAAAFGHPTTARLLVARGADVNAMDPGGETPLHKATRLRRPAVVARLLQLAANVNATDMAGNTPLFWARHFGYKDIAQLLKDQGA